MGNFVEKEIKEEELLPYLKPGLTMNDLVNLKNAFISLDTEGKGTISYDVGKISDIKKYDLEIKEGNQEVELNFDEFMNMMTENIISNRLRFGANITYESEASTVTCFFFPSK